MRALSTAELLTVWELVAARPAGQRALALLTVACTEETPERLAQLSIGQCDERLLTLREQAFGPQLAAVSDCPACRETLQFEIKAADIRTASRAEAIEPIELKEAEYEVRFRLPNSLDLAELDPNADEQTNRQHLLRRCVLAGQCAGANVSAADLPTEVVSAISERMAKADPLADIQLALACPQCGHRWNSPLDIVSFFWSEIHAWAVRLLNDIHVLASAYGWCEADILSMSAIRRQAYLDLRAQ